VNPLVRSYTQDALDRIGHELERRYRNDEPRPDYMEYCRRRDEFDRIHFEGERLAEITRLIPLKYR
jgi:hypothetical protein